MKKVLFLCVLSVLLMGCKSDKSEPGINEDDLVCCCPACLIYLQPYGDFTKEQANKLLPKLQENFDTWLYGHWKFVVLDPLPMPKEAYVKDRARYKAIFLLDEQLKQKNNLSDSVNKDRYPVKAVIGLTHKDICTNIHNVENYGIVGLSYRSKYVGVVSDKRLKDKSMMWKPVLHEFMHAFCGSKHCPNDDPTCFMKDAKGHGNFAVQNHLCDSCKY